MAELEIHYSNDGDWAALYVDGKLVTVGDSYRAEEKALDLTGVKCVHDEAFMRGGTQRSDTAQTLDEVNEYKTGREMDLAMAADLESQANTLLERAKELRG